ncbi:MAG TPA: hypothetical protein VKE51_13900 [Vicinamibacterales bacterium]|nr:hypothetical protein [Vicinamibacterales bacterium]
MPTAVSVLLERAPVELAATPVQVRAKPATAEPVRRRYRRNCYELVAVLFAGTGSIAPVGGAIEVVLTRVPVADALTNPVTVNVLAPPWTSVTIVEIDPKPFAAVHADPGVRRAGPGGAAGESRRKRARDRAPRRR